MNASEKNYAVKRLRSIASTKRNSLLEKHRDDLKNLKHYRTNYAALSKEIASGKVKLKKKHIPKTPYRLIEMFDTEAFNRREDIKLKKKNDAITKYNTNLRKTLEKTDKKINDTLQHITDKIMLGSSDEAIKLIEDFTNQEF